MSLVSNQFLISVQVVNATNTTLRYDVKQKIYFETTEVQTQQILLPTALSILQQPTLDCNETVRFLIQPVFILLDNNGDRVNELSGNVTWVVTASLDPSTGDPNARLEGELAVAFINGTANFTDLAISHNGTGYRIDYRITNPVGKSLETFSFPHEIKERQLGYRFQYNFTGVEINVAVRPSVTVTVFDIATGNTVNTEWKNQTWTFQAFLYDSENQISNNLNGNQSIDILNGHGNLNNLTISSVGQYFFQLIVSTNPLSSYGIVHITPFFNVTSKEYYIHVARHPGDCNDTVVCGVQPILELRNKATNMLISGLNTGGRTWMVNASECNDDNNNPLRGTTYMEITSPSVVYTDLYFVSEGSGLQICFNVTVFPSEERYENMDALSNSFDVLKRKLFMFELVAPGQADENKVFNQQPIIEIRDVATNLPAYPLTEHWELTVSLHTTQNGGTLNGNLSANVTGAHANFTDLRIDIFGVGFVLEYTSNHGVNVSANSCFENSLLHFYSCLLVKDCKCLRLIYGFL